MLETKNIEVFKQLLEVPYHPILIEIVTWIDRVFDGGVVTCGYRLGDSGVHGTIPCRGMDLRDWIYEHPEWVEEEINREWIYDPNRLTYKVCVLHDTGSGSHLHIQVHQNTQRRKS